MGKVKQKTIHKLAPSQVAAPAASAAMPSNFKPLRVITLPSLVLKMAGDARALKFLDAMRVSSVVDKPTAEGKKKEPATICGVIDVATGEQFTFLVPAVVKANLIRDFPGDTYVGKVFWIECLGRRKEGQRYNDFKIVEGEAS